MTKLILTIINIVGGFCMCLALVLPFTREAVADDFVLLFAFNFYLLGGFVLWYFSAKAMEQKGGVK